MKISIFFICVSFMLFGIMSSKAQTDCVYDNSSLTGDFLKTSKQVSLYKWDDVKKEGVAILNDGAILSVRKWACDHIGTSANMMIIKESYNPYSWKGYFQELVEVVCSPTENQIIEYALAEYSFLGIENGCRKEIDLSNEMYPEFYLSIYELEDIIVVSVFYYKIP